MLVLATAVPSGWSTIPEVAESSVDAWPPIERPLQRPVVGERISFHGRWFGLPVGYGWIEIKELIDIGGRSVYHVQAEGRSNELLSTFYPIHDALHSYFDAETFRPLRFEKYQREGQYRAAEVVTFDYASGRAVYQSLLNGAVKEIPIPDDVHDIISAFYWLRAQPIRPHQSMLTHIYSDEKIYQAELKPRSPVLLELLRRGSFPCLVFEPVAAFKGILVRRGRIWVYITSDARRMPVFTKITTPWGPITGVIDLQSIISSGTPAAGAAALASNDTAAKE